MAIIRNIIRTFALEARLRDKAKTMFTFRRYTPPEEKAWNAFVARSKNGTFLLDRRYMDYHAHRFHDFSLMIYRGQRLYALLPGHSEEDAFRSHDGLTYGGLILDAKARAAEVVTLFEELNDWLRGEGLRRVTYKRVPWIYHRAPSEEDLYALFKVCEARLAARDISSVICLGSPLPWSQNRRYCRNRALRQGVEVAASEDFEAFWEVLRHNLLYKYGVSPVHSLDEMRLLYHRFPDNIRLYVATAGGEVIGGTVLYVTPMVVHAQYISASPEGKELGAIDAIYDRVLRHDFPSHPYFDFGKSTEDLGRYLNTSLIHQKEGFGARAVCYDTYSWEL